MPEENVRSCMYYNLGREEKLFTKQEKQKAERKKIRKGGSEGPKEWGKEDRFDNVSFLLGWKYHKQA